jgi:heat-inducible transcriptional repressor
MDRLEDRSEAILRTIVAEYVDSGEPVGSRTVAKCEEVGLSAASIRNIMSDLTESGYIAQPHVSAGRVPTDRGYRYYVDNLLVRYPQDAREEQSTIESLISAAGGDIREVLRQSSAVLAGLSRQAVISASVPEEQTFKKIEFIKVADDRILVVLVSTSGFVQNKMIYDEDALNQETLERYGRMLNDVLSDLDLRQARERIERELALAGTAVDAMLTKALRLGHIILSQETEREVFIEGRTNILDEPEFSSVEQLKALLTTFEEKSKLLKILDKTLDGEGLQIFIGSEHGLGAIEICAIVAYPIRTEDSVLGSISVIGPKRMDYPKVISLVDITGRVVTHLMRNFVETSI